MEMESYLKVMNRFRDTKEEERDALEAAVEHAERCCKMMDGFKQSIKITDVVNTDDITTDAFRKITNLKVCKNWTELCEKKLSSGYRVPADLIINMTVPCPNIRLNHEVLGWEIDEDDNIVEYEDDAPLIPIEHFRNEHYIEKYGKPKVVSISHFDFRFNEEYIVKSKVEGVDIFKIAANANRDIIVGAVWMFMEEFGDPVSTKPLIKVPIILDPVEGTLRVEPSVAYIDSFYGSGSDWWRIKMLKTMTMKDFEGMTSDEITNYSHKKLFMTTDSFLESCDEALKDWYAIQLLLLNPIFNVCINDKGRIPVKSNKSNKKNKRPIRYMRQIVIDNDLLIETIAPKQPTEDGKKYTRHTMLWHVAGHWYERNGKRYFRQGHWKGPLAKSMKSDNPSSYEPRDREVVINPLLTKKDE